MHIIHTALYTFTRVLTRRICQPFNSQINFVILPTVNHTILIMFFQRILYWINYIIPKLIFFVILITYLVDIVLIL